MQVTTITFFKYKSLTQKVWAFGMMQFAHRQLSNVEGLEFYKLLGTGRGNGFNPYPDWSTYALLLTWSNQSAAEVFFNTSKLIHLYRTHSTEISTIYMRNIISKGEWSGSNPFSPSQAIDTSINYLSIITRATIKTSKLRTFWKYVPTSEKPLKHNDGLIFTKGVGEVPVIQMATFSIWKDEKSLKAFAYQSNEHHEAIKKTRELGWYSEELFARFQPFKLVGTWEGKNLLEEL